MKGRLLIFWDYDTQWGADRSRSGGGAKEWGALEFPCTDRLLELHGEFGIPACFAVVGAAARPGSRPYHDPGQIRAIHQSGHEVASHSFRHEWLPGLRTSELLSTLRESKMALEECIGAEVGSFVPPYNQPFDFPARLAFSLSERREARLQRNSIPDLCRALKQTGYRFCRIAYTPLTTLVVRRAGLAREFRANDGETVEGVFCLRQDLPAGFSDRSLRAVRTAAARGGTVVVYGHPHSLSAENSQNERSLVPFLGEVRDLVNREALEIRLPRDFWEAR